MKTSIIRQACFMLLICALMASCHTEGGSHKEHDTHEEEEHAHGLELTEEQMQTVGIRLGSFSEIGISEGISATGELAVDPRCRAEVAPLMPGLIKEIYVTAGQQVRKGMVVAAIENVDAISLREELAAATARLQLAQTEYDRQKKLAQHGAGISKNLDKAQAELEIERAAVEAAKARMKTSSVSAPISGIVASVEATIGAGADISRPLLTIVDNSSVFALLRVYEKDLEKIHKGDRVSLRLTNGSAEMQGLVEEIVRALDPSAKTIDVKVRITEGKNPELIPGMALNGFISPEESLVRALPEEAVVSMEGKSYIYVLQGSESENGRLLYSFRPVEVAKGASRNGMVEISPVGDIPGDARIVVAKAFYLASMEADHGEHNH